MPSFIEKLKRRKKAMEQAGKTTASEESVKEVQKAAKAFRPKKKKKQTNYMPK